MRHKTVDQLIKDKSPIRQVIILLSAARLMVSPINYVNPDIMRYFKDSKELAEIHDRLWALYARARFLKENPDWFV